MNIFKKWFSKQDKQESQDDLSNSKVLIVFGADDDNENFITIDFEPEYKYRLAEMIFMLNSGLLLDDMLAVLKEMCDDEDVLFDIVRRLDEISKSMVNNDSAPVVDPCEVFNNRSDNEFKG